MNYGTALAGVVILVAVTGCLHGSTDGRVIAEDFDETDLSGWVTDTYGSNEGEVTVRDGELFLRVYKCHNAVARKNLGEHEGNLTVEFDWRSTAEQWYERPGWRVETDDGNASYTVVNGTDLQRPDRASTASGSVVANVTVNGTATLVYEINPSEPCDNNNHANTTLAIDDVVVTGG